MSIRAISWALSVKTGSPITKLVLIKLADNANDSGKCWPSVAHLVEHTELSERAIRGHIKTLADGGFLTVEERFVEGVQIPNVYHLQIPQSVGVVHDVQGGGALAAPPRVQDVHPEVNRQSKPSIEPSEDKCSEPQAASELVDDGSIRFPTNRKGEEVTISPEQAAEYAALYPSVDVPQQLRHMRGWLLANREKRKTAKGVPKFINSWLARQQDRGGGKVSANGLGEPGKPFYGIVPMDMI